MRTVLIIVFFYSISVTIFLAIKLTDTSTVKPNINSSIDSNTHYKKIIKLFNEDTIKVGWTNIDVYRFFWLPAFHDRIMIKVSKNQDSTWIMTKRIYMFDEKEEVEITTRKISKENFDTLKTKLRSAYYWHLPRIIDEQGLDGATWIMEAYINGKYKQVNVWSPPKGSFKDIGIYLFELAGIKEKIY